jgi:hypothetical protein
MTTAVLADLPDDASTAEIQAFIENAVMTRPWLAEAARRAGGRWQVVDDNLYFAPWVPLPIPGLTRRYWSDRVEVIIGEEFYNKSSVYASWHAIKSRCENEGLSYPKMITLHKRIERSRKWTEKFGIEFPV